MIASQKGRDVAMEVAELASLRRGPPRITSFKMSGFGRGGRGAALRQVGPVHRWNRCVL